MYLKDHLISDELCWLVNLQYNLCSTVHCVPQLNETYDTRPCKPICDYSYFPLRRMTARSRIVDKCPTACVLI